MKYRLTILLNIVFVLALAGCTSDEGPASAISSQTEAAAPITNIDHPTPIPLGEQVNMSKWALWTGDTPLLRGANIYQRLVYPELDGTDYLGPGPFGPPFIQRDFGDLAALGANYVNISHPGLFTEQPPFEPNPEAIANLDNLLAMIEQADMFAVISFRTGPGRSEFTFFDEGDENWFDDSYLNDTVWQDQTAQDAWVAMWQYTAERYRDNPIVVGYDLMVEPNAEAICCDLWDETDEFYPAYEGTLYDWNQFFPRMIAGIRAVDPDTPVIVGSLGMSQVVWLPYIEPADDPYTVYAVHQYAPGNYTHQELESDDPLIVYPSDKYDLDWDDEPDRFDKAWLDDLLGIVDDFKAEYDVPVTSNEFGLIRYLPGAARFMDDQMDLFEARSINSAVWEWGPSWPPLRDDQQAFAFRLGTDPNNYTRDASSDLQDVIIRYWQLNTLHPSNVQFVPAE